MTEGAAEEVAHKLGIPWPEAEEGQLRQAADAFDAAARALDAEREVCSAKVRTLVAHNSGGGMEEFEAFWGRYEGSGAPGGGAMVATAQACRDTATALRSYADEVEQTKDSIRDQISIAGATLIIGGAMAVMTFGFGAGAAAAAAASIASFAAAAGVALSATAATIAGTVLVGAAFGAVEAVALNVLLVQPLSVALDEQEDFEFGQLPQFAAYGAGGGFVAGGVSAGLGRLPVLAERTAATMPRVSASLDELTHFTTVNTVGRLSTNAGTGAGTTEAVTGGGATGFDLVLGAAGGMASPNGRRGLTDEGDRPDRGWARWGLELPPAHNKLATSALRRAMDAEPHITATLQSIRKDTHAGRLADLDHRVKTAGSYRRKVASTIVEKADPGVAVSVIRDVVRYTFELSPRDYASSTEAVTRAMQARGFEPTKWKNSWDSLDYRGINSTWRDPRTGQHFEVQFHTPQSRDVKERTHSLYEQMRLLDPKDQRRNELRQEQSVLAQTVDVPPSALDVFAPQVTSSP